MKITIGEYDATTGTVEVVFDHDGVTHKRRVNACRDDDGAYDAEATVIRVDEVARGVQHKIGLGVITNQVSAQSDPTGESQGAAEEPQP